MRKENRMRAGWKMKNSFDGALESITDFPAFAIKP